MSTELPESIYVVTVVGLLSVGACHVLETPLTSCCTTVNAASKGHLPVVLYLLTKQSANPLVRNNWGETAFDVAAAVFEVWICEVCTIKNARLEFA
jgi:hypothetical protein